METKKQEAIRLAWEKIIGKEKYNKIKESIYENGSIEGYVLKSKLGVIHIELEETFKPLTSIYRPKSLSGIEDNNGWISIESEEDLKLERGYYWFKWNSADGEENIQIAIVDNRGINLYQEPTHYQPIQKPNPPIF